MFKEKYLLKFDQYGHFSMFSAFLITCQLYCKYIKWEERNTIFIHSSQTFLFFCELMVFLELKQYLF